MPISDNPVQAFSGGDGTSFLFGKEDTAVTEPHERRFLDKLRSTPESWGPRKGELGTTGHARWGRPTRLGAVFVRPEDGYFTIVADYFSLEDLKLTVCVKNSGAAEVLHLLVYGEGDVSCLRGDDIMLCNRYRSCLANIDGQLVHEFERWTRDDSIFRQEGVGRHFTYCV
jgi:hypothetical protein